VALTAEQQAIVTKKMEHLQRQKTMQQVIDEMAKLQEFVDKSEWDAFFASILWHGGGFFLIGEYFMGVVAFIMGYAITLYGVWVAVQSALSYFWNFERNWMLVGGVMAGSVLFDVIIAIWSAVVAVGVRERSRYALQILRERCNATAIRNS